MKTHPFVTPIGALFRFCILFCLTMSLAQAGDPILETAERYVQQQMQGNGLSGQITIKAVPLPPSFNLPLCATLEAFTPNGAQPFGPGRVNVGVRCVSGANWSIFVGVNISVITNYQVSSRPIIAGQVISSDDLMPLTGDLARLPRGIVTDPRQAIGKTLKVAIAANQPIRQDLLTMPSVVMIGQTVKLSIRGQGFSVTSEGRALNSAAEGQIAQVRMNNGQNVSGVARNGGVVELNY